MRIGFFYAINVHQFFYSIFTLIHFSVLGPSFFDSMWFFSRFHFFLRFKTNTNDGWRTYLFFSSSFSRLLCTLIYTAWQQALRRERNFLCERRPFCFFSFFDYAWESNYNRFSIDSHKIQCILNNDLFGSIFSYAMYFAITPLCVCVWNKVHHEEYAPSTAVRLCATNFFCYLVLD